MSTDYPGLPYVQATGYSPGRPDGPPLWLVFHTMEVSESLSAAEGTARYFADPGDGRNVSSHTCVDADSAVQCVRVNDQAWCAGNRPGNRRGIHIEQAGRAAQSAGDWQDDYSQRLIRRVAAVHARDVVRFGIPIRWLTVDEVKAGHKGFCTHNDLRLAFGGTTHWDPGPNYPKTQVAELFRQEVAKLTGQPNEEDDVGTVESLTPAALKQIVDAIIWRPAHTWEQYKDGEPVGEPGSLLNTFMQTHYAARQAQGNTIAIRTEVAKLATAVAAVAAGTADDATTAEMAAAVERMEALAEEDRQRDTAALAAAAQQHAAIVELLGQYQSGEKDAEAIVNELIARLATLAPQPAPQPS